jgi:hypothetical protein
MLLQELALRCLHPDSGQRPIFADIASELLGMLEAMGSAASSDEDSQPEEESVTLSNTGFFESL